MSPRLVYPVVWARDRLRQKGFVETCKIAGSVARDLFFDFKYGTDTMRWVDVEALDTSSENKFHAVRYQATKAQPFLTLLETLSLPRDGVFVDFGSGKGRVLLMAARYGFALVRGIEFSAQLCAMARRNVEVFSRRQPLRSPIEIVEFDVTRYRIEPDERVFYLYNSFDVPVMAQVLVNIRRSVTSHPRRVWFIYNTPKHHDLLERAGVFRGSSLHAIAGNEFRVYWSE